MTLCWRLMWRHVHGRLGSVDARCETGKPDDGRVPMHHAAKLAKAIVMIGEMHLPPERQALHVGLPT